MITIATLTIASIACAVFAVAGTVHNHNIRAQIKVRLTK